MLAEYQQVLQTTQHAMGTVMTHKAFGLSAEEGLAAVCREIDHIEQRLSRFLPTSEISFINAQAGKQSCPVSSLTFGLIKTALDFSQHCAGAFDITITPLVQLWSQCRQTSSSPDAHSIQQALDLVDYRDITIDSKEETVGLNKPGQAVDLGGIGKGFAADRIMDVYERYGVTSAYSNLGGNVVTVGAKPDGAPWRIGIQHPRQEGRLLGVAAVENQSVVTSGDYQRFYMDAHGNRIHHILDPRTGYPARSGLVSVSIITERSVWADALSTLIFVSGLEKGVGILRQYPAVQAVLVDEQLHVFVTSGLKDGFQPEKENSVSFLS
jgi:thiamine biosynthesis lipoprotein